LALAIGALVGAGFVLAMFAILGERASDMHLVSKQSAAMIATCMLGTLVCWAIVRAWYWLRPPDETTVAEC
jgi:hypothetical protein